MKRRGAFVLAAVLVCGLSATRSSADDQVPAQWPAGPGTSPTMAAMADALRLAGPDRYQTNLALELTMRGRGAFPFGTPDRSNGWWGTGTCPGAVVIVAGDVVADALAATPLSDPTDQSSEPRLRRTATSDPMLHPVDAFARVDTVSAPVIVTPSARQGATSLSVTARTAARDSAEAKDGCLGASQAIVVGGTAAVPSGADDDLLTLGYDEVFRVAGADRYATAAAIAASLGTATTTAAACLDTDETDGSTVLRFYANSVVEVRLSQTTCQLSTRSVVLADGISGIDALAAGWMTSFFQVPVLLTGPGGSLPAATTSALTTMDIDNLIVLGGTGRIPPSSASTAASLASANVVRVAGQDRYATSVKLAETFGGWWPTSVAKDAAGSMVCLLGSRGSGDAVVGAADALGAGPLCAAAAAPSAGTPTSPLRAMSPTAGAAPATTTGGRAKDLVPILLTDPSLPTLAPPVADLLDGVFAAAGPWCSSAAPVPAGGCSEPGFVVAIGGAAVLPDAVLADADQRASGGTDDHGDQTPSTGVGYWTRLDMSPIADSIANGTDRICFPRAALTGVRWLGAWADAARTSLVASSDVMLAGAYVRDADGGARSPGQSAPACLGWSGTSQPTIAGVSLSGHVAGAVSVDVSAGNLVEMSAPVGQSGGVLLDGTPTTNGGEGLSSHVRFSGSPAQPVSVNVRGQTLAVTSATLDITITRGTGDAPTLVVGDATLTTPNGTVRGHITGEAIFDTLRWRVRGAIVLDPGDTFDSGRGGFTADLDPGSGPSSSDDTVSWQFDALVS